MVKALAPSGQPLKFQGRREYPIEPGSDDWGLNATQQETYVEQFRRLLATKSAWREDQHDYFTLRRFLRARGYDLEKATIMWMNNLAFKQQFKVDTILQDFYFNERDKFLTAYPQGYHKTDKLGRPIYIQLLGQVDVAGIHKVTNEDRMIKFHIQEYERCLKVILPICSRMQGRQIDQTFGIMDVKGVGLSHLTGDVKRILGLVTKYDQDNYPETLGHICVINAPRVFKMIWSFVKGMLDPRTQSKIEILDSNYMEALLKWVDIENLPDWLGGKSHGTLADDVGPWSDNDLIARLGLDIEDLRLGRRPAQLPPSLRPSVSGRHAGDVHMLTNPSLAGGVNAHDRPSRQADQASAMSDGYASPGGSSVDLSANFRNVPSGRHAAVDVPLSCNSNRSGGSGHQDLATGSANGVAHNQLIVVGPGGFASIPEVASPAGEQRPRTLVERLSQLERLIPQHMERLKPVMRLVDGAAVNGNGMAGGMSMGAGGTHSTRSAPEGSLLYRVEVLEEAVNTLLAAEQVALQYQQQQLYEQQQQAAAERTKKSECCCCCVM